MSIMGGNSEVSELTNQFGSSLQYHFVPPGGAVSLSEGKLDATATQQRHLMLNTSSI